MNKQPTQADNSADVEIADRIMHAMIVKGVNLKGLAADTGISYSTLRRSLHQTRDDRRSFSIQELCRIAGALNTPASTLLPDDLAARDAA
jgi:transcriptional regulator with XRE-family HTH domain